MGLAIDRKPELQRLHNGIPGHNRHPRTFTARPPRKAGRLVKRVKVDQAVLVQCTAHKDDIVSAEQLGEANDIEVFDLWSM